ncbi:MAG: Zn-ribbon domain-containing OB-fold protein [bacterium]|nr:Zn-ribbon domain-containing OB-fold protein [bacterium]
MSDRVKPMVLEGKVDLPFSYSAGRTASRFLINLRDQQRIMGKRCPECSRVIVPARLFCSQCFTETDEWVEVGPEGSLISFTVVYRGENHHPKEAPLAYGIIRLDGADTSFVHLLAETDEAQLQPGRRVRAVFSEKRIGHILDIKHFEAIGTDVSK